MKAIIFAVLAGLAIGLHPLLSRLGMKNTDPLVGSFLLTLSTTIIFTVLLFVTGKWRTFFPPNPETKFLVLNGVVTMVFLYLMLSAYKYGMIKIVAPVQIPLGLVFSILFAILFLRERLNFLGIMGILVILSGVGLVIFSRVY